MWRRYLRFLGSNVREDVDDELRFHLEMRTHELIDAGMQPEAARIEAIRQFGDPRQVQRELLAIGKRSERMTHWTERLEAVSASLRYAPRRMRRSPGFTLGVVLTFALGIGANAVMFGIVDRLLLSPPAHVNDPGRVHQLLVNRYIQSRGSWTLDSGFSYPDYVDFARAGSFSVAEFSGRWPLTLGRGPDAHQVNGQMVSGSYFSLLGVRPLVGRFLGPTDDAVGAAQTAVLSYDYWRSAYGGDPGAVGRTLDFGYGPYTIVGVAPQEFNGTELLPVDFWLPEIPARAQLRGGYSWMEDRYSYGFHLLARLSEDMSAEGVGAEATGLHLQGRAEQIESGRYDPRVNMVARPLNPAERANLAGAARVAGWLLGISFLVLLIACANVANLLLARAVRDRHEIGIRLALGGSRARVLGQVLTEGFLLAALGGVAALIVTRWGGPVLRTVLLPDVFWPESGIGGRVVVLVLGLAAVAGLAAGVLPAFQASRPDVAEVLKSASSRTHTGQVSYARGGLTVLQAMLSVVLLVGAGLFVRSLQRVSSLDLGFDPDGVFLVTPVFEPGLPDARQAAFYARASEQLRRLPGVLGASSDVSLPFWSRTDYELRVPGLDSVPTRDGALHVVEPEYFELMRLRIARGRALRRGDTQALVVNETMARLLWPEQEALGKCVIVIQDDAREPPCAEVVGIVEDSRQVGLEEAEMMHYYLPLAQQVVYAHPRALLVRMDGDPGQVIPTLRRALLRVDPSVRYAQIQELTELVDPQTQSWRIGATMFSLFGLLALLVSAVGLYSVLAFSVAQRRFEFGIRAALGATPRRLIRLVLGQALRLVTIGILLGVAIAITAGGKLEPLLFEVSPRDPLVLGSVIFALLLTALAAAWIPSRRATRVDPAHALRTD
jgi:predicted permease